MLINELMDLPFVDRTHRVSLKSPFKKMFIYLFMRDPEREAETPAEGEAGSMQGAQRGTRSRIPGSLPKPEAGTHGGATQASLKSPFLILFLKDNSIYVLSQSVLEHSLFI